MIDLIPGVQFSDTEKQVYGSIAGVLLGALIGTLTTFFIANRERKKQDETHKIRQNRTYLRENAIGLQMAGQTLTDLMIKCQANNEYVTDIKKGLIKKDGENTLALMQLSTPFNYQKPDATITQQILNDRIITLWANLCQEVELQNKNVNDFADYYKTLFSTIHTALLKGERLDMSVVESDNATIARGMDQQLDANGHLRRKCLDLLAYIDCFAAYIANTDPRDFRTLEQYRMFIGNMANYEPSEGEFQKARSEEEVIYDPKVMFKSKSTGEDKLTK